MAEQLTMQQEMAVKNRGGKLLVSAAAGSGKTKVLVDRLISYITDPEHPANLDEFLIITYTKAAASELRGKIAAKLTQLIAQEPGNRHLRQQMQRLYLTKISTVHSFCGDILREYAYSMDIAPDFRVADETECLELQVSAMDKVLNETYDRASEDPDFCAFVDTQGLGRDDRQIPQIVLQVYQSSRCHLDPDAWLQWCEAAADTDELTDAGETIWGRFLIDDLKSFLGLQIDALTRCKALAAAAIEMEKPTQVLAQTIDQLEYLRASRTWDEIVERKQIDYGRLVFSKKITDAELADRIKAIRTSCKDGIEKKLSAFAGLSADILWDLKTTGDATRGLIALTRNFSGEYERRKRSRRILDFGDLEHRMLDLLLGKKRSGPTAIARELGSRYREIMVDEYQDSNAVQDAIFEALTFKKGNCFMVGDVKQSIYQFRLADPEIFVEKYNRYQPAENAQPGDGRKVLLSNNFRSSGGVISAVNDVFTTCMSETVGGLYYGADEQLYEGIPHISLGEPEVELYGIEVNEDTYAEEAAFVANRISTLLDGTHMVRQGDTLRPIRPEDIVILLRSPGSVGSEFMYALENRGIRCTTGGSIDLLQTEEISSLRSWLQVINNPLQDIPLIAVLTGRVVGLTADELAEIRAENRYCSIYEAAQKAENPKIAAFFDMLDSLRTDARLYPLPELLQRVFRSTRIDSIYAAMPDGEVRTSNLQTFCQIAADFESGGRKDLSQFIEHLSAMDEKGLVYPGQLQESGAVTIMSIHKSKGLEFPVVFLCGLSRRFNLENARSQVLCHKEFGLGLSCVDTLNRVRYPTIAKRAISEKIIGESISEELRVLYVAMTRPKDRLIMTYAVKNLGADLQDIAQRMDLCDPLLLTSQVSCPGSWVLQTAMRRTEAGAFFALGGHPDCVEGKETAWMIKVAEAPDPGADMGGVVSENAQIPKELIEHLQTSLSFQYAFDASTRTPSKQTATQLKGRLKDQEAAENTNQVQKHTFRKAGFVSAGVRSTDYGTAMHSVMQYIDYKACSDIDGVRNEVMRLAAEERISAEYAALVKPELIAKLFETPLGQKLRSCDNLLREFKFSILEDAADYSLGTSGDEILLQGVVDCAMVEQDGITIIDYKTDYVTEETIIGRAMGYAPQVSAYADAMSRIYNKPIKSAYLYFFCMNRFVKVELP
ncbi:MAG: helicase-exonuclease AddAB subunit AddA [Oscillospiraceae bacterium]|nr:helicase-exonuclease AddAB subunit AddA [Oscillospiraceae bacterium]